MMVRFNNREDNRAIELIGTSTMDRKVLSFMSYQQVFCKLVFISVAVLLDNPGSFA